MSRGVSCVVEGRHQQTTSSTQQPPSTGGDSHTHTSIHVDYSLTPRALNGLSETAGGCIVHRTSKTTHTRERERREGEERETIDVVFDNVHLQLVCVAGCRPRKSRLVNEIRAAGVWADHVNRCKRAPQADSVGGQGAESGVSTTQLATLQTDCELLAALLSPQMALQHFHPTHPSLLTKHVTRASPEYGGLQGEVKGKNEYLI